VGEPQAPKVDVGWVRDRAACGFEATRRGHAAAAAR
jgi:hypothetical protein